MKVYLAGKISKNDWRHQIFTGLDRAESAFEPNVIQTQLVRDEMEYNGPYFLSCDHGCYHGDATHGRMQNTSFCTAKGDTKQNVVRKCYEWIHSSDRVFVWLDSEDAFGTITEIGYATALNKPIFIGIDVALKGTPFEQDIWFPLQSAYQVVYCKHPHEAWALFVGKKKKTEVELATTSQLQFIETLCRNNRKQPVGDLQCITKEAAGKMIAYLHHRKFFGEMAPFFTDMTEEQIRILEKEEPKYKATEVIDKVKQQFAHIPDYKFTTRTHAKYVRILGAKENQRFTKVVGHAKYNSQTIFYSEAWIETLIEYVKKHP